MTEVNYVAVAARAWAAADPVERWVNAAADGPSPLAETISEYLAGHDPFPADSGVEARWDEAWEPAVVIERTGPDEWLVEFDDGGQAWRDHHELRPRPAAENAEPAAAECPESRDGRHFLEDGSVPGYPYHCTLCGEHIGDDQDDGWVVAILR